MSAFHNAFEAFLASPDDASGAVTATRPSGGLTVTNPSPEAEIGTTPLRKSTRTRRRKKFESSSSSGGSDSVSTSYDTDCNSFSGSFFSFFFFFSFVSGFLTTHFHDSVTLLLSAVSSIGQNDC